MKLNDLTDPHKVEEFLRENALPDYLAGQTQTTNRRLRVRLSAGQLGEYTHVKSFIQAVEDAVSQTQFGRDREPYENKNTAIILISTALKNEPELAETHARSL